MSRYRVEVTKAAEDDLEELKDLRKEAVKKLLEFEDNPADKTSTLSGNLKGLRSYKFNLPAVEPIELSLKSTKMRASAC